MDTVVAAPRSRRSLTLLLAVSVGLALLALGTLAFGPRLRAQFAAPPRVALAMPTSAAIEERWGIRISQIGATADGGMVDFRFVVLDADKASAMMADVSNLPVLLVEDRHMVVNSASLMPAKHDLTPGVTYFLLYRNTQGAVRHGGEVTVAFNDLRLAHVPVR